MTAVCCRAEVREVGRPWEIEADTIEAAPEETDRAAPKQAADGMRDCEFDILYVCDGPVGKGQAHVVVDYDVSRPERVCETQQRCCELSDVDCRVRRILVNVLPHQPNGQFRRDFAAATCCLLQDGELVARVREPRAARRVQRLPAESSASVESRRGVPWVFQCRGPRPGPSDENAATTTHVDSVTGRRLVFAMQAVLFSFRKVNVGTSLLLDALTNVDGSRLVDLGCGYGVIGAVAAVRGVEVAMLDCDIRAVCLARRKAQAQWA